MAPEQLQNIFSYHQPEGDEPQKYEQINAAFLECATKINDLMPPGPGHTVAIRKLADARMAANAAVALKGTF